MTAVDSQLLAALEALVEPTARGEPDSPLRWTIRSTQVLAKTLTEQGHTASHATAAALLDEAGFRLQAKWKVALQELADATGLALTVCHFPPGTSKWNKIEHRLFSFVTQNWRGKPLLTRQAIVELIGNTRSTTGRKVKAALDPNTYATGKKVAKEQLRQVKLKPHRFHGEWNYTIRPHEY